jgi:hypothetical protein
MDLSSFAGAANPGVVILSIKAPRLGPRASRSLFLTKRGVESLQKATGTVAVPEVALNISVTTPGSPKANA